MQNGSFLCWFSWYVLIFFVNIFIVTIIFPAYFRRLKFLFFLRPETVPLRTVNRQCSSGLQAVADVAAAIKAGFYDIGELFWCLILIPVSVVLVNSFQYLGFTYY